VEFEHEYSDFNIEIKKKSDKTFQPVRKTKNKFLYFASLESSTLYVLRAFAYNSANNTKTKWSSPIEVKTLTTPTFVR
jgi:hypothetical protein